MKDRSSPAAWRPVRAVLLLIPILIACASECLAQAPSPASPLQLRTGVVPQDPAFDAKVKEFFQKMLQLDDPNRVQLGPTVATPMAGLSARHITITTDKGQANAELFTDASHNQVVVGTMYDLLRDPWTPRDLRPLHLNDRPAVGPADAAVTIIEFADFECPHCARAFSLLENMVHNKYKGNLRIVFKYYPLNSHPWAKQAAYGAECARLQNPDDFWEFARYLFANQGTIDTKNVEGKIDEEAKKLSLDVPTLDACMRASATAARVAEDGKDGDAVGVSSTPTFFVNGIQVVGLPDEKAFDFMVRGQVDKASQTGKR